jgi:GNAT superfamily N-acetyltransferase
MIALTQEVATGIAGGLIVSFLTLSATFIRGLYIRRKYPVGGKYLSDFEDTVRGQRIVQTSVSRLKQRGRHITGKTIGRDGRTWLLDGSIMGIGHISGVYSAEAIHDEGVGAFYLRARGLVLEGLWAGYDHMNKTTTSGRYIFRRLIEVNIQALRMAYTATALAIAEKVFGPNYLSETDVSRTSGLHVFVALYDRKVVGLAAIEVSSSVSGKSNGDSWKLPMDIVHAEKNARLGIIKTVGVSEELQGHGIGEQLFVAMEAILKKRGMILCAVPAWEDDSGVHLRGILTGNGYEPFLTCPHYWKDACDAGAFSCRCRQGRSECICNLIWYKKPLA